MPKGSVIGTSNIISVIYNVSVNASVTLCHVIHSTGK